ncbi:retinoid-inducible serine carboxypeptidase [Lampetra planeri]
MERTAPRTPRLLLLLVVPPLLATLLAVLLGPVRPCAGAPAVSSGEEKWGYVAIRPQAKMFWWLYPSKKASVQPLVLWLQGGPGASGTGFGNFEEIGPLDVNLQPRKTTWLAAASLLFVDNPVGTGYSYVTYQDAYAHNISTVATDMRVLLAGFFAEAKEFQTVPFYIFSESYGGKMAAAISLELLKAINNKEITCAFKGVALGDSWISPLDSVLTWGPYLHATSLLDKPGLKLVMEAANAVKEAYDAGQYANATRLWSLAEDVISSYTNGVNFYNILTQDSTNHYVDTSATKPRKKPLAKLYQTHVGHLQQAALSQLMNGAIRKKLEIIPEDVRWGGQSEDVFTNMAADFMKPVIDMVDELLSSGVKVTVYNGQLDLIVDTLGQESWVQKMKWPGLDAFNELKWSPLSLVSSDNVAYHKSYGNFTFYWILKAGHMVPLDQGDTALELLRRVTGQESLLREH